MQKFIQLALSGISVGVFVSGCATTSSPRPFTSLSEVEESFSALGFGTITRPSRQLITGDWTQETCQDVVTSHAFSADGTVMTISGNGQSLFVEQGGEEFDELTYLVLDESPWIIRMIIDGEVRQTDDGRAVQWDLVLVNDETFCWHRADWGPTRCTAPRTRCSG